MNIERLVKIYNRVNDKRVYWKSESVIAKFQALGNVDDKIIEEIIRTNKTNELSSIINPVFVKNYIEKKELQAQLENTKKKSIEEEKSNLSLGLVEKALARVMVDEYAPKLAETLKSNVDEYIKQTYGKLEKQITYSIPATGKKLEEVTHEMFETVLNFVVADEPVMLVGPAGTGKNVICKQIAKLLNLDFYFTNAVTQEYKLTGFIDANGVYHETEFYKAFKNGGIFMLDEIDASIPEVLIILNAAIANRYFDFPNGKIEAHKDFRVVAAGNTFGHGASYTYVGRNQLDGASLDRFALINIDYSERIENSLTKDQELIEFIHDFRKACDESGLQAIASYRSITRIDKMMQLGMDIKTILKTCLLKNLEEDDIHMISTKLHENKYSKAIA